MSVQRKMKDVPNGKLNIIMVNQPGIIIINIKCGEHADTVGEELSTMKSARGND